MGTEATYHSYTRRRSGLAGTAYVEREGVYELVPLKEIAVHETTRWGKFCGLNQEQGRHYWKFEKQKWNPQAEVYENSYIFIAATALVHPRTIIHPEVWISDYAVIADGVELLAGARVDERQVIASGSRFHHLNDKSNKVLRI